MTDEIIGMILSIVGMLVNIASFQAKNKRPLLLLQSIASAFFLLSYVFTTSGIGIILNIIYLVRNTVYMFSDQDNRRFSQIMCIFLCASYILSYAIYTPLAGLPLSENLWNIAPVLASIIGTVAAAQKNVNHYRMWKYGDSWCWLAFNAHIGLGALGGVLGEVFNQISLTVGLIRFKKPKDSKEEN